MYQYGEHNATNHLKIGSSLYFIIDSYHGKGYTAFKSDQMNYRAFHFALHFIFICYFCFKCLYVINMLGTILIEEPLD